MKKEILFVLLKDFADWEGAYIAPNLNAGVESGSESKSQQNVANGTVAKSLPQKWVILPKSFV